MCYCNGVKIESLDDVETALRPYSGVAKKTTGQHITLARTEQLMAHIGNPERLLRVVHVAGTSGKTSTTYYTSALLGAAGSKVGSTISPYVDGINERIQIQGKPLSEKQFCRYFGEFVDLLIDMSETPSRFEVLIAFAYWVFAKEQVDYAVVETGMGGLDDSTNVAARADKLCLITDIGYDHMELLGDTLGSIAYQKAGIVHEGNTVLMYDQSPEIMQVVRYWVSQQEGAELLTFEQARLAQAYAGAFVPGLPQYQKRNWLLAFAAYKWLAARDNLSQMSATKLQKTQELQVPARMDMRSIADKTIVMDGAHNGQKMTAFWQSFAVKYPGVRPTVLFALKQGKEMADIAPLLRDYAGEVVVTTFEKSHDVPVVCMEPSEIASVLTAYGVKHRVVRDPRQAYKAFLTATETVGVITGSFFFISQLRESHKELK
jgi:dihydrofolate synthase/folylpolyglutamate synthase